MNVFENLVAELQEENLLEKTFVDLSHSESAEPDGFGFTPPDNNSFDASFELERNGALENGSYGNYNEDVAAASKAAELVGIGDEAVPIPAKPSNGREFYKKRAVAEISNLQMVEHVLTGVEREYMKIVPNAYDDFNAKKALNTFLQVTDGENSSAHTEADYALMNETEAWCSALAKRDREIYVSSLRQYCENSRPPLSSQALLALARFYRNLPYSEAVRSKFDFVITRLFSRPAEHNRRICLFTKDEMLAHVNTLYKDWSSVALYSADDNKTNERLTALSFADLATEAERAERFDDLIASDFFGRVRLFKESISEMFYAPKVVAAAIDANVRIGNTYVTLIERERQIADNDTIQAKYGSLQSNAISDAAARTLDLVDLLRLPHRPLEISNLEPEPIQEDKAVQPAVEVRPKSDQKVEEADLSFVGKIVESFRTMNRIFLGSAVVLILLSFGIYIWANYVVTESAGSPGVAVFAVANSGLEEHAKSARISGENFYIQMQPSWDLLPKEKRTEYLQKALKVAQDNKCVQVSVMNKDGKPAGYASASKIDPAAP